jgi:hypothetical protein
MMMLASHPMIPPMMIEMMRLMLCSLPCPTMSWQYGAPRH